MPVGSITGFSRQTAPSDDGWPLQAKPMVPVSAWGLVQPGRHAKFELELPEGISEYVSVSPSKPWIRKWFVAFSTRPPDKRRQLGSKGASQLIAVPAAACVTLTTQSSWAPRLADGRANPHQRSPLGGTWFVQVSGPLPM